MGKVLVHRTAQGVAAGRIVEAEPIAAPSILQRTARVVWPGEPPPYYGPPGYAYVFLLYGISWAMNLVTTADGAPHAVLVRRSSRFEVSI